MRVFGLELTSRFGPLSVVQDGDVVIGASYQHLDVLVARMFKHYPDLEVAVVPHLPVADVIAAYDGGDVDALSDVQVRQPGGPFMQRAWLAMRAIPAGKALTYAQLAAGAGNERAVRAAGTACSANLVAPFVPCHRVIRTGGHIGNYGFGVELKQRLLDHELASAPSRQ